MYMNNIKLFAKNAKRIGNPNTGNEDKQTGYRDRIQHSKMYHANNENRKKIIDGKNTTTKSTKIRTHGKKETYKYFGKMEADTIKQVEMKEKILKYYLRRTGKLVETKLYGRNSSKG